MRIVQCWDDGVVDDIRLIEILRKHGAKATFNLNFGLHTPARYLSWRFRDEKEVWKLGLNELRSVYEGFPIANHTLTHPWVTRIPPDALADEIQQGKNRLEQHFGFPVQGFVYPFGDTNRRVKEAVRAAGHIYARTVQNARRVYPPANALAFHPSCHALAANFWTIYERVKAEDARSGCEVFYFWGHSYELVREEDWQNFDAKIARLSAESGNVWMDVQELFEESNQLIS